MNGAFQRTRRLIGEAAMEKLARSRVAVFGLGGVGGSCAEALARSGVGTLDLIDSDEVVLSNLNRQAFATRSTIGMKKTDAAKERIKDISPSAAVNLYPIFYLPETADQIPFEAFDYVVDAIDTVTAKIDLILRAKAAGVPIISCMGTTGSMLFCGKSDQTAGRSRGRRKRKTAECTGLFCVCTPFCRDTDCFSCRTTADL